MATTDQKYTATEESTSKNPQDWGRSMALVISRLTVMAEEAGDAVENESLLGEELHLNVQDSEPGVSITVSWTPRT